MTHADQILLLTILLHTHMLSLSWCRCIYTVYVNHLLNSSLNPAVSFLLLFCLYSTAVVEIWQSICTVSKLNTNYSKPCFSPTFWRTPTSYRMRCQHGLKGPKAFLHFCIFFFFAMSSLHHISML